MEDSPEPDVRALFGGGNLLAGRGYGGDGGVGPMRVSYLHGVEAVGETGAEDISAAAEGGATCPIAIGGITVVAAAGSAARVVRAAAGSEDGLTRGLNEGLCSTRVFAMAGSRAGEEEWRRKGFSPKNFFGKWFEKKYNGG